MRRASRCPHAHSLAMSFYPVESAGSELVRATQYLRDAVQNFSRRWTPYPYPAAVAPRPVDGMEYPAMVSTGWAMRANTSSSSPRTKSDTAGSDDGGV